MTRGRLAVILAVAVALAWAVALSAEVKTQEKTQVKFEGTMGRVMGLFGGKAAKEGIVSTVAVKGDRKMRVAETRGEIIDLAEEKVYDVDFKDRSYKVKTFAQIRQEMEEAMKKAKEDMAKSEGKRPSEDEKQMEMEIAFKETGQHKTINGFDCREVITTLLMHEKGKKIEESGGMAITSDSWLAPKNPGLREIAEFDAKYWKALQTPAMAEAAQGMAQALAMYPGLGQALQKMQAEKVNMDGTPIQSTVTIEAVQTPEQAAQAGQQSEAKPSGGLLGGLGRFGRSKKTDDTAAPATSAAGAKGRVPIMTTVTEVLSVAPAASDADVSIPAGFKQK